MKQIKSVKDDINIPLFLWKIDLLKKFNKKEK